MKALPVIIFNGRLLPSSETFVKAQSEGLNEFEPYYVGARFVQGIDLSREQSTVVNFGGFLGSAAEIIFKQTGFAPHLYPRLHTLKPKLIHAHFGVCGALALPIAEKLKIPLLVTFHGFDASMTDEYARRNSISTRVYLRRREALKRKTTKFIAVSDFIKKKLVSRGFPEDKIWTHYIGVDTIRFQPNLSTPRKRAVLFVGRLVEKKGCEYLIRAMAKIQASEPDVDLIIIGDGPLRGELEEKAAQSLKRYQFLGLQPSSVVKDWMNQALLLATPSVTTSTGDAEGLPTVVIEAQSAGLPVVGTFHAGIPEAVLHRETGLLCQERDWETLAEHISYLLRKPESWQNFSHKSRERILTHFNLRQQIQRLEKLYQDVLSADSQLPY